MEEELEKKYMVWVKDETGEDSVCFEFPDRERQKAFLAAVKELSVDYIFTPPMEK